MRTMGVDIETYSSVDIDNGVYAYSEAPDFEILLIGYTLDDGENVEVIDTSGMSNADAVSMIESMYPDFYEALKDPETIKTAFNANFERTCLAKYFGEMAPEQWKCTAVHAATLGLPRSLGDVGAALGLPQDKLKDKQGKALITYFCKPCKPTKKNNGRTRNLPEHDPEKWALFTEYNRQDVVAEQAILEKLRPYPVTEFEQRLWCFDQKMNDRGINVDMDFVRGILQHDTVTTEKLIDEARTITNLSNPNSLAQVKQWFNDNYPYLGVTSLTKDTIDGYIDALGERVQNGENHPDEVMPGIRLLEIRKALGKTSTKKYVAMENAVCKDNKLRGILQFYGANRTGRWAGRIVQVHNLPQNKIPDIDLAREVVAAKQFDILEMAFGESAFVFSQLIRTAFVASPGRRFVVSDFSAIEARVIAWLSDEKWRQEVFATHGKIYEASASQMFHIPIENIKKGSKLRQQGKIAELALGYGGGFGAIKTMDKDGSIPDDEIPMLVANWRAANPNIVKLWKTYEAAAKTAITERRSVRVKHNITFSYINHILFVKLPSGRKLAYYDAAVDPNEKDSITYGGVNQDTKKWGRQGTYGGKLVENIVQAVARDCLAVAMMRVDGAGYEINMHVHDEMVVDVPNDDTEAAKTITDLMGQPIDWAPGLLLRGDTYETPFYKKD